MVVWCGVVFWEVTGGLGWCGLLMGGDHECWMEVTEKGLDLCGCGWLWDRRREFKDATIEVW
jgi:hypothetical protein